MWLWEHWNKAIYGRTDGWYTFTNIYNRCSLKQFDIDFDFSLYWMTQCVEDKISLLVDTVYQILLRKVEVLCISQFCFAVIVFIILCFVFFYLLTELFICWSQSSVISSPRKVKNFRCYLIEVFIGVTFQQSVSHDPESVKNVVN